MGPILSDKKPYFSCNSTILKKALPGLISGNSIVISKECFKDHLLLEISVASFISLDTEVFLEKIFNKL